MSFPDTEMAQYLNQLGKSIYISYTVKPPIPRMTTNISTVKIMRYAHNYVVRWGAIVTLSVLWDYHDVFPIFVGIAQQPQGVGFLSQFPQFRYFHIVI